MEQKNQPPKKRKSPFAVWPKRILALAVVVFCLFVGITTSYHFTDSLGLIDLRDPSTWNAARLAMDAGYNQRLFSGRPAQTDPGTGGDGQAVPPAESHNPLQDAFVDINGLATDRLGKRELNEIIKLDNGYITAYQSEKQDLSHQVAKTIEFSQFAAENGNRFVFVMAPHLINKYDPMLPPGVTDYSNEMADEFLQALSDAGIATIDIRELMQAKSFDHYGGFFRTDHHWKPQTALWAADAVMRELEAWGWLNTAGTTLTPDAFATAHDPVQFYGTAADRTGAAFAGEPDELDCVVPTNDIVLRVKPYLEADFSDPVSFEPYYRGWEYAQYDTVGAADSYYLYKTAYDITVMNESAAADNHLMLVCDSFGVPFQSFLAGYTKQLTAFQGREHPDFITAVDKTDIVMVLYNPSSLDIRTENANIFNFR